MNFENFENIFDVEYKKYLEELEAIAFNHSGITINKKLFEEHRRGAAARMVKNILNRLS